MYHKDLAFVDVETTGGRAVRDRITEIAIITVRDGDVVSQWSSLVNPHRPIPERICRLTGITNAMVEAQPGFNDLFKDIYDRLEDCIFVAHNARFDYGFIKNEFKRCQVDFRAQVLCTVKLSRRIYPQYRRHNLDSVMQRHAIQCSARHRAMGDARVLYEFLQELYLRHNHEHLESVIKSLLKRPSLPANISEDDIQNLPESPGVYLFYDRDNIPLYIGKSINVRERVLNHFSSDHSSSKEMKISQNIASIDFIKTCGELGALLTESKLIKQKLPSYNYRLRRYDRLTTIEYNQDTPGSPEIITPEYIDASKIHHHYGLFKTRKAAKDLLLKLAKKDQLCLKKLGLEAGTGACFAYQLKQCKGACIGQETELQHHLRLLTALQPIKNKTWPYAGKIGIRETCHEDNSSDIHIFDNWCYLGTARNQSDLDKLSANAESQFDLDSYKILISYLKQTKQPDIIKLDQLSA